MTKENGGWIDDTTSNNDLKKKEREKEAEYEGSMWSDDNRCRLQLEDDDVADNIQYSMSIFNGMWHDEQTDTDSYSNDVCNRIECFQTME